jgi:nitroimidazol reductase NimA-like FMN-containing flavoprotein (pyridoxamine 5'-phosphate oxidase superfamily)
MRETPWYGAEEPDSGQHLAVEECWELLAAHRFGRLAFHLADEVHLVPVNYLAEGGRVLVRTAEGSKLLGVHMNPDVAFEIDEVSTSSAWSVVLRGRAHVLDGAEHERASAAIPTPWTGAGREEIISIEPAAISGRRFTPS